MAFEPIENYGVIGNMQSIALVGMNGSIDFLCYPNFDSPTIFAALLDDQNGGRFRDSSSAPKMRGAPDVSCRRRTFWSHGFWPRKAWPN